MVEKDHRGTRLANEIEQIANAWRWIGKSSDSGFSSHT